MRFPYQSYPVRGTGGVHLALVYRPAVPVHVLGPAGDALVLGLVDTGADDTLLPDRFLGPLGVSIRPGDQATITAFDGGTVIVRYATVDLELGRRGMTPYRWSARVAFHAGSRVLLGHAGFLDYFTATFNGRRRHVTLTPNGTAPLPSMLLP